MSWAQDMFEKIIPLDIQQKEFPIRFRGIIHRQLFDNKWGFDKPWIVFKSKCIPLPLVLAHPMNPPSSADTTP